MDDRTDKAVTPADDDGWAFPSRSRCPFPDCGSLDTVRTTSHEGVQYRECRRCGRTYKVIGWRI